LPFIKVTLQAINQKIKLTPKITRDAPVRVAEWPPLGHGGTPSI
jgi:hypothetical protein